MRVDGSDNASQLRLVQGAQRVTPAERVAPSAPSREVRGGDGFNFEAVYRARLPKANVAEAIQRLDDIRTKLVAARTAMPIHFETALAGARGAAPGGAVARAYLRFAGEPAQINAAATEAAAARPLDETA